MVPSAAIVAQREEMVVVKGQEEWFDDK